MQRLKVTLSNIGSNPIFFAMIEKLAKWLGKRHNVPCNLEYVV